MQNSLRLLSANALAAFLDFSVGIFIIALLAWYSEVSVTVWGLLLGGWLALLPDFDSLPTILRGREVTFDHRQTLFHRPLILISLAVATAAILGG